MDEKQVQGYKVKKKGNKVWAQPAKHLEQQLGGWLSSQDRLPREKNGQ
jgi:hypothetical protein